jgi:hypothetical protein
MRIFGLSSRRRASCASVQIELTTTTSHFARFVTIAESTKTGQYMLASRG